MNPKLWVELSVEWSLEVTSVTELPSWERSCN